MELENGKIHLTIAEKNIANVDGPIELHDIPKVAADLRLWAETDDLTVEGYTELLPIARTLTRADAWRFAGSAILRRNFGDAFSELLHVVYPESQLIASKTIPHYVRSAAERRAMADEMDALEMDSL